MCITNRNTQVTKKTFDSTKVGKLNMDILLASCSPETETGLQFDALYHNRFPLRVYADTSYTSKDDLLSKLGYLLMLCEGDEKFHMLYYASPE